jgi:nicotinate-nucleotide adenylyltransferase
LSAALRRIGVFGGAFDPPHAGHRALAQAALQQLQLDALHVVPTGEAWHKARGLSPAAHRLAMVQAAFEGLAQVVVDPRETRRSGPSYTVDTLRELQAEFPDSQLFLIVGQDQAAALPTWRAWQEVLERASVCVAGRPDAAPPVSLPAPHQFLRLDFPLQDISATDIRRRIASGEGVAPLVGAAVARYIADHHLYQPLG